MGFPRQEFWSGLPFPSPGELPDPGTEIRSLALQADSLLSEPPEKSIKGYYQILNIVPCAIKWVLVVYLLYMW